MDKNIFIHFETFGIQENSILTSVSVFVDPEGLDSNYTSFKPKYENLDYYFIDLQKYGLFQKLNMDIQKQKYHRTVDNNVVNWWNERSSEVKKTHLSNENRVSFEEAFINIHNFLSSKGVNTKKCNIWSKLTCHYKWWLSLYNTLKCDNSQLVDYLPFYRWKDIKTALFVLGYQNKNENSSEPTDFENKLKSNIDLNPINSCIVDYLRISKAICGGYE